jgi:hypothetical protein
VSHIQQELLTLTEHSSSPTVLVVFVLSFLCSVLNIIVCPFVLFLAFVINFFYIHQSLLNTALWIGSADFWVTDELNMTTRLIQTPQLINRKGRSHVHRGRSMTCYFYVKTNFLMDSLILWIFSLRVVAGRLLVITGQSYQASPPLCFLTTITHPSICHVFTSRNYCLSWI